MNNTYKLAGIIHTLQPTKKASPLDSMQEGVINATQDARRRHPTAANIAGLTGAALPLLPLLIGATRQTPDAYGRGRLSGAAHGYARLSTTLGGAGLGVVGGTALATQLPEKYRLAAMALGLGAGGFVGDRFGKTLWGAYGHRPNDRQLRKQYRRR
jgi:hypothetical protein